MQIFLFLGSGVAVEYVFLGFKLKKLNSRVYNNMKSLIFDPAFGKVRLECRAG